MKYRADIDGLRAVSVLAVVFFHAQWSLFSGGFVGVDVFFVISGFLITRIIVAEIDAGNFSLVRFYERRIRRIAPALLFMAAFVIAFTLIFKTPKEARSFGESISFFGLMASNQFFLQERGYFDVARETFALLHTWSLAVEEQFYLVFPLLLAGLTAWVRPQRERIVLMLTALSFAGAAYVVLSSIGDVAKNTDAAFYFAPLRAWELLVGSLLAMRPLRELSPGKRQIFSALGLALILLAVFAFDKATPFPGPAALAPCIGAALLIIAGEGARERSGVATRALSLRPMVFIGLASYSYYLWHWPLLSFAQYYAMRELTLFESLAVVAAAFAVAVLSLWFVERPFRGANGLLSRRGVFVVGLGSLVACILVGVALQSSKGWPQRFSPEVRALTTGDSAEFGVKKGCVNQRDRLSPEAREAIFVRFCKVGDPSKTPEILLWGDSHAGSISPAFQAAAERMGTSVLVAWRAACAPVIGYVWPLVTTGAGCRAHNEAVFASLPKLGIKKVLMFANWADLANGFDRKPSKEFAAELETNLLKTIKALQAQGITVILGLQAPEYKDGVHIPSYLHREAMFGRAAPLDRSRAAHERHQAPEKQIVERVAAAAGVALYRLDEKFCDAAMCAISRDGKPLYADHGHINVRAARALAESIAPLLRWSGRRPE
ncbi:MAG: acyltransferase [Neomegalonema sp.]|nr:acyltransferase [Neomegalonema sp.]